MIWFRSKMYKGWGEEKIRMKSDCHTFFQEQIVFWLVIYEIIRFNGDEVGGGNKIGWS